MLLNQQRAAACMRKHGPIDYHLKEWLVVIMIV